MMQKALLRRMALLVAASFAAIAALGLTAAPAFAADEPTERAPAAAEIQQAVDVQNGGLGVAEPSQAFAVIEAEQLVFAGSEADGQELPEEGSEGAGVENPVPYSNSPPIVEEADQASKLVSGDGFVEAENVLGSDRIAVFAASQNDGFADYLSSDAGQVWAEIGGEKSGEERQDTYMGNRPVSYWDNVSVWFPSGDSVLSTGRFWCVDPSAAAPDNYIGIAKVEAFYSSHDVNAGTITYRVIIEPNDSAMSHDFAMNYDPVWGYRYIGYQRIEGLVTVAHQFGGYFNINKVSACPDTTDGNPNYSLEGAIYGVYSDYACTNQVTTLTTGVDGNTQTTDLMSAGTYYVKEIAASRGFMLDSTVYSVDVVNGQTATVTCYEVPCMDPANLVKMDKDRYAAGQAQANIAQGGATLEGAEYEWRYYEGLYETVEAAEGSGAPVRSWVFKTNEYGVCYYDDPYLVSGPALYRSPDGIANLPLGTVVVFETKAPQGYLLSPVKHIGQVVQSAPGQPATFRWVDTIAGNTVFFDKVITGGLELSKVDQDLTISSPQGDATLYGAVFEVWNANENSVLVEGEWYEPGARIECLKNRVITDRNGKWTSDDLHLLPYGTYTIKEIWSPQGYNLGDDAQIQVKVLADGEINNSGDNAISVENKVLIGGVRVQKYDLETGLGAPQGEAALDATFGIVNASSAAVVVGGKTFAPGEEVAVIKANAETGVATFEGLPYGTYYLFEKEAPTGYLDGNSELKFFFRIVEDEAMVTKSISGEDISFGNQVIRFGIQVDKTMVGGPVSNAEGIEFAVYDSFGNRMSWIDAEGNATDVIRLDADGFGATPDDALPYGTYSVVELAGTVPANVLPYAVSSGTGEDLVGTVAGVKDHESYRVAVENMLKPELDIIKIDGDAFVNDGVHECISIPSVWVLERLEGDEWVALQTVLTVGGKAEFDRSLIDSFGTYRLREVASPGQDDLDGWMMPEGAGQESSFEFVFDKDTYAKVDGGDVEYGLGEVGHELSYGYDANGNALVTATAINWRYRQIVAHKVDAVTGEGVVNTVFTLEKLIDDEWVEVGRMDTDGNGDCVFKGLEFGTYRLAEIYPNPDYFGPEEGGTIGQFIIEVNEENGQSQIQVVEDKPIHVEEDEPEIVESYELDALPKTGDSIGFAFAGSAVLAGFVALLMAASRRRARE